MPSIDGICDALGPLVLAAIGDAGITTPGKIFVGWPVPTEAVKIWGKGQALVSLWPAGNGKQVTRYAAVPYSITPSVVTLTATVADSAGVVVTFGGSVVAGLNVHTVLDTAADAYYQTTGGDTLASVATAVAAAITALALPGITASAAGPVLTIHGVHGAIVNIGKLQSIVKEIARMQQDVWVTSWPASPDASDAAIAAGKATRPVLDAAIMGAFGGSDSRWQTAGDGSRFTTDLVGGPRWSDKAESSYSVFRSDIIYSIEYPILQVLSATPIGAVVSSVQLGAQPARTSYYGGP